MLKPNNYDEVQVNDGFTPIELGGHFCEIKKVEETQSKNGKDMIVVYFDFANSDRQPRYFTHQFNDDTREDKKWPFAGRKYIMVNDFQDENKTSKQFKGFCSSVENSNKGFSVQWGDDWGQQFVGKSIGAIYGREESEYNGEVKMRTVPKWFCKTTGVESAKVPADKLLKTDDAPAGFTPKTDVEDIPF